MSEEFTMREFVYIGYAIGNNGGLIVGLCEIDGDKLKRERWYKPTKELKTRIIGGVYRTEATDAKIRTADIIYAGRSWRNQDDLMRWRLQSDLAETRDRIAKLEKKARASDVISDALDPIIKLYRATDPLGRRALEALILDKLRRGI